jgi:hypothetical protein
MNNKIIILILYFISWPVNSIHRLWNRSPPHLVYWYIANPKCGEDIQWYIHDIGQCISYILIFIATWLYIQRPGKRDSDINYVFGAILVNQCIDLVHYVGWHRRCEEILLLEGVILLFVAIKLFLKSRKPN